MVKVGKKIPPNGASTNLRFRSMLDMAVRSDGCVFEFDLNRKIRAVPLAYVAEFQSVRYRGCLHLQLAPPDAPPSLS
jgi:hypothetical protein